MVWPGRKRVLFTLGAKSLPAVGQEEVHARAGPPAKGHATSPTCAEGKRPAWGEEEPLARNALPKKVANARPWPADPPTLWGSE